MFASELHHWLIPQWPRGIGLPGWEVSSWAQAYLCPEPSMAPTDHRTQPGALGGGQLQRPETRALSWPWDLGQVHIYSEFQFPHPENGEDVLYLTVLPRTEEFLGMEDFFCVLKPGKFQANWDKLVTYRVVGRGKERMHEKHPAWGLANGGGGWGPVFAACQLTRPLRSAISQTSQRSCLLSL